MLRFSSIDWSISVLKPIEDNKAEKQAYPRWTSIAIQLIKALMTALFLWRRNRKL
jgi:hypothetical protein